MAGKVDRRSHARFMVTPGVFAVLGPYSSQIGPIVDISQGGLAFQYKQGDGTIADTYEVSILFDAKTDNNKSPFKFNAKVISDVEVRGGSPFSTAVIRRFSMEFKELTYYQQAWLTECIQNHTTGKIDSNTSSSQS